MFLKLFRKIQKDGMIPRPFCEASFTLKTKSCKHTHTHTHTHKRKKVRKEKYRPLSLMNIHTKNKYLQTEFNKVF
jgi:hypothetical protein